MDPGAHVRLELTAAERVVLPFRAHGREHSIGNDRELVLCEQVRDFVCTVGRIEADRAPFGSISVDAQAAAPYQLVAARRPGMLRVDIDGVDVMRQLTR